MWGEPTRRCGGVCSDVARCHFGEPEDSAADAIATKTEQRSVTWNPQHFTPEESDLDGARTLH